MRPREQDCATYAPAPLPLCDTMLEKRPSPWVALLSIGSRHMYSALLSALLATLNSAGVLSTGGQLCAAAFSQIHIFTIALKWHFYGTALESNLLIEGYDSNLLIGGYA
jgi:hypothetical protein